MPPNAEDVDTAVETLSATATATTRKKHDDDDDDDPWHPLSTTARTDDSSSTDSANNATAAQSPYENENEKKLLLPNYVRHPLSTFLSRTSTLYSQLTTSEISGSLGDLGTFIPLTVALARQRSIYLAPALFFAGLSNVVTGYAWDVPVCVQPMKSIAAVALSENLSRDSVSAAGVLTGGMVFLLGVSNLIEVVNAIVPKCVVSGLQLGVGFRLASKGMKMVQDLNTWAGGYDCILTAVVCAVLCLYWLREGSNGASGGGNARATEGSSTDDHQRRRGRRSLTTLVTSFWTRCSRILRPNPDAPHPVGVYLFVLGTILAVIELSTTSNSDGEYDLPLRFFGAPIAVLAFDDAVAEDWKVGFLEGAVPQLPLTTLNSVISVCCLAHSLYPEKRRHPPNNDNTQNGNNTNNKASSRDDDVISRRDMSISVGLMNVLLCPFGAMPNCHGAGGLAGQHRFGARHGVSVVFLGLNKMILSIFFGASALTLLDAVPASVLGIMLVIAGVELSTTGFMLLVSGAEEDAKAEAEAEAAFHRIDDDNDDNVDRVEEEGAPSGLERMTARIEARAQQNTAADMSKLKKMALRKGTVIATVTATVIVSLGKTHYGALSGWVAHMVYGDGTKDWVRWWKEWRSSCRRRQRRRQREGNVQMSRSYVATDDSGGAMTSESSSGDDRDRSGNRENNNGSCGLNNV